MKEVFLVTSENRQKAEDALRKDDALSRGSITLKYAQTLGILSDSRESDKLRDCKAISTIDKDCYFIIIDHTAEQLKRAEELLKGLAEKYKNKETVLKKLEEQENSAIEGFGNILG